MQLKFTSFLKGNAHAFKMATKYGCVVKIINLLYNIT